MTTATKLEELRSQLVGRDIEGTEILDAEPELSENMDGEERTRVWLLLSEPEGETWDVEVIRMARRIVREEAQRLELPGSFIRFAAERDEDLDGIDP